jgi:hypothetical protein
MGELAKRINGHRQQEANIRIGLSTHHLANDLKLKTIFPPVAAQLLASTFITLQFQTTNLQIANAIAIILRRSPKDITDKTYNQTPKKSRKTETQNLDILSSTESKDRHKILDTVKIHFPRKSINVPKRYN